MADITGTEEDETLDGTPDDDTIEGLAGDDTLNGGEGDDTLFGGDGDDELFGGDGNDTLDGGFGTNTFDAGPGDDLIIASGAADDIDGGPGVDTVEILDSEAFDITGAVFAPDPQSGLVLASLTTGSVFTLTNVEQVLRINSVTTQAEETLLLGTTGDDDVDASAGERDTTIFAGDGDDTLVGSAFNDLLVGGAGDSVLDGGLGDDVLVADLNGTQALDGGTGDDTVLLENFAETSDPLIVTLTDTSATSATGAATYQNTETVIIAGPTDGDDTVDATATTPALDSVVLLGDAGNDTLIGGATQTVLWGGAGQDTMTAGAGPTAFYVESIIDEVEGDRLLGFKSTDSLVFAQLESADTFGVQPLTFLGEADFTGQAGEIRQRTSGSDTIVEFDTNGDGTADRTLTLEGQLGTLKAGPDAPTPLTGFTLMVSNDQTIIGTDANEGLAGGDGDDFIDGRGGSDEIIGGGGDDTLLGGGGRDLISGGPGDDVIDGGNGADEIRGGPGTNTLDGGAGNDVFVVGDNPGNSVIVDTINGGDGFDELRLFSDRAILLDPLADDLSAGAFNIIDDTNLFDVTIENVERIERFSTRSPASPAEVILLGGAGNDDLDAGSDSIGVSIAGFEGDDTLSGSGFSDTLYGGLGDDTVSAGAGDDTIIDHLFDNGSVNGGAGDDQLLLFPFDLPSTSDLDITILDSQVRVNGGEGSTITLDSIEAVVLAEQGSGDDRLDASGATIDVVLQGGDGDDTLSGGAGRNFLRGGAGADSFIGGSGINQLEIIGIAEQMDGDTVLGFKVGDGIDLLNPGISGGQAYFLIEDAAFTGRAGDIRFARSDGDTRIEADLDGDRVADSVLTLAGVNVEFATLIEDVEGISLRIESVTPSVSPPPPPAPPPPADDPGAGDRIEGSGADDSLRGTGGDDVLLGRDGDDDLRGSSGNDTVNGEAGNDFLAGGTGDDTLLGGFGDDVLNGGADDDRLDGGAGEDRLLGGGGNDTLDGGDDDDLIQGGRGADIIDAGRGDDRVLAGADNDIVLGGFGDDFLAGASGDDTLFGEGGDDTLNGAIGDDRLDGGFGNDLLNGGAGRDDLSGGNGADILRGQGGADSVLGGNGNDQLFGGGGDDTLAGDGGNDTIFAGGGDDIIRLGGGEDTIRGQGGADSFIIDGAETGSHTVKDFRAGETIILDRFDFSGLTDAAKAFSQDGSSVVFAAGDMTVSFEGATLADVLDGLALESGPITAGTSAGEGLEPARPSQSRSEHDISADAFDFGTDDFTDIA